VSRQLAVVFAHPDDDTFGVTGTAAIHANDPEFHLTAVLATSGEHGMISDPSLATAETLGAVREREDRASWRTLGREPDRHEFFRLPDGGVPEVPFDDLVDRIAAVLGDERPDVVVTFGPEGITAHPDHIRVGEAATEAFHRVREEAGDGFRRLLHAGIARSSVDRFSEQLVARGMDPIDQTALYQPHGVPDGTIGVRVDCSGVWKSKLAALREHRTQADDMQFPDDLIEEMLRYEEFVQAWPERDPGAPVLGDVFDLLG
jgi:LmbE family N-acetylglucosaminyl deacetylase